MEFWPYENWRAHGHRATTEGTAARAITARAFKAAARHRMEGGGDPSHRLMPLGPGCRLAPLRCETAADAGE
jgi:hypothetical protein